ncbi:MAG: hypothetical protein OEL83_18595 [Desulforhopalus sp.]|nr:hypothetical protein [Desulforhopalus sp.]
MGKNFQLVTLLLVLLVAACSRLPSYGQPRGEVSDGILPAQIITYRTLTIGDFRAVELPEDLRDHGEHLNAHTTAAIRTRPGGSIAVTSFESGGKKQLCGRAENLAFEAVMIPERSWWSPALSEVQVGYVLQHEQVHFALMEIAARQLNQRAAKEPEQLSGCAEDSEAAANRLSAVLDRWLAEAEEKTLRLHSDFDEATSNRYAPREQQRWYERVMRELESKHP